MSRAARRYCTWEQEARESAAIRCLSERPSRASLPLALSMRTWSQPAAARASRWASGVLVDCRNPSVANPHWLAVAQTEVGVT